MHCSLKMATKVGRVVRKACIPSVAEVLSIRVGMLCYSCEMCCVEYCVQLWLPHWDGGIKGLLAGLEELNHQQSLDSLGLFSLEQRMLRGKLTEVYKMM